MLLFKNKKDLTDEQLMQGVCEGDAACFGIIYDRYADKMMRYFYRMLGQNVTRAEDFTQDIFTKLIEKPNLFDTGKKFSTWLYAVALNMCKNEYRRLEVRRNTLNEEPHPNKTRDMDSDNFVDRIDKKTFLKMLDVELGLLDEKHRTTFLLRYQEEMSIKEISEVLGISEGTIKSRLFYTLRKLSEKLKVFDLN
ncbi:MAG: RNA polymerase sigma factor [Candidatus Competibacteraceae bacterium]|nr:RNA polymerase sigma factor [Candidatus Competibacteraceae bacterium]